MNRMAHESLIADDRRGRELEEGIRRLSQEASRLGVDLAEVSGAVQDVADRARSQSAIFAETTKSAARIVKTNDRSGELIAAAKEDTAVARASLTETSETLATSQQRIGELREATDWMKAEIESFGDALTEIGRFAKALSVIAKQTNLLAINASVEAARAGEVGRGFAVVASEVQTLSQEAAGATANVQKTLELIGARNKSLVEAGAKTVDASANAIELSERVSASFNEMEAAFAKILDQTEEVAGNITSASDEFGRFRPQLDEACGSVRSSTNRLDEAARRVEAIVGASEKIIQTSARLGVEVPDSKWIAIAQDAAAAISRLFEEAIARGRLSADDAFDQRYEPIAGTEPEQVKTRFTAFTDEVLPEVQEAIAAREPEIVFCAAVDQNGYLPTHNKKFSHPQRPGDPVWNAANSRNRRIFDDRTGLSAGRNSHPFLIQTYRRDMGGGQFVMMKDVSAPIVVNGRHWGGFRVAVKV
ncbi:MAG: methyl-accepting chemotaxis protein [Pseudomonadota bacterium]